MSETISILDGSTFVTSDLTGDIQAGTDQPLGFFFRDTRHLSRWLLTVDGRQLERLSTDALEHYFAQFFLYPPTGTIYKNPYLTVQRKRLVADGFVEVLDVGNESADPIDVEVRLDAGADFADLFDVKDAQPKKGQSYAEVRDGQLVLGYRRDDFVRETHISADGAALSDRGLTFTLHLEPKSRRQIRVQVRPVADGRTYTPEVATDGSGRPALRKALQEWLAGAPQVTATPEVVTRIYRRSMIDLAALRFRIDPDDPDSMPAAGLPWFMALFGRDSIITSYQALPFAPELAVITLRQLARRQGRELDEFREEEPGKILHELRLGELTAFHERPQSPYYGACDTTPLFLVLLDEVERWTGDRELVREMEGPARAALDWIDTYGDRDGDGYLEYQRTLETGLENQCWKDSWNSIMFADGTLSEAPRATCEIQGYTYDAKRRAARLARTVWDDDELATRLDAQADELKARFNRDFWLPDRQYFALALDRDKRPVDSLTSNIGHLLWSGIVDDDKADAVAAHLMGERLFSGWGVRTMAVGDAGYNPIEYHNGTVWPHDNSLIAAGLARYGYRAEAAVLVARLLIAALYFDLRLPEAFAGFPVEETAFPVEYPTSCSPQAWATGAPLLGLRVLLGLEPDDGRLTSDPVLPMSISRLDVRGIPGPWGRADARGEHDVDADFWTLWFAVRDVATGAQGAATPELMRMLRPATRG
jgi:glycogen debranching enzyme